MTSDRRYNNSGRVASGRHDFSRVAMPRSRVARWRAAELHGASGAVRNRSHTTEGHGHTTEVLPGAQPHDQNNMLLVSGYIFVDFQTLPSPATRIWGHGSDVDLRICPAKRQPDAGEGKVWKSTKIDAVTGGNCIARHKCHKCAVDNAVGRAHDLLTI